MPTEAPPASPLTVWVGSMRYVFPPGPDVVVGSGGKCQIRLDLPRNPAAKPQPPQQHVVLRFADTHWVAIDRSRDGIFVDGARVSTVDIRDGLAITIGDPRRGPRLVFQIGSPDDPPPKPPHRPKHPVPTEQNTGSMRAPAARPRAAAPTPVPPSPVPPSPVPPPPPPEPPPPPPTSSRRRLREPPPLPAAEPPATRPPEPLPEPLLHEAGTTYRLPVHSGARTLGVAAYQVGLAAGTLPEFLSDVSFTARPGTLTAVLGPSAARNAALLDLLGGDRELSFGRVTVDGHDVHAERASMRNRIGIVQRDNRVDSRLTVERALMYAAELRLPPGTLPDQRSRVVDQVLDELELTPHRATRIRKLPPEMQRCAAMAIELISRPTLLVVDEPGAGLDEAQENHVMAMLRRQADLGCVVVVAITTQTPQAWQQSVTHLSMYNEVLLLTPTGTVACAGPPAQIESAMGTSDWSHIFARLHLDPDGAHRDFLDRQPATAPAPPPPAAAPGPPPAEPPLAPQIRFVARRQLRLLLGSPVYSVFLVILTAALAGLTLLIPGKTGLGRAAPSGHNAHEAIEILAALNIAAVIIGSALTIRELVGERRIFRREQSLGLSTSAYLLGKIIVFSIAAAILTAVLTTIVVVVKGGPVHGAVLLHNANVELYVTVAITAIVSAIVGLALSTVGNSLREVVLLLLPVILASLLFAGGLVPLVGTWGYDQISWFVPAQWGFAASASTADLHRVDALAVNALMWTHYSGWWVFDMVVLAVFGALWAGFVRYRLRPPERQNTGRPVVADVVRQ